MAEAKTGRGWRWAMPGSVTRPQGNDLQSPNATLLFILENPLAVEKKKKKGAK